MGFMDNFKRIFKAKGMDAALEYADEHWDDIMPTDAREIYHMTGTIVKSWNF